MRHSKGIFTAFTNILSFADSARRVDFRYISISISTCLRISFVRANVLFGHVQSDPGRTSFSCSTVLHSPGAESQVGPSTLKDIPWFP